MSTLVLATFKKTSKTFEGKKIHEECINSFENMIKNQITE